PPYNRQLLILPDGTISYPDVGIVQASGKTVVELQEELRKALEGPPAGLRNPRVNVTVVSFPGAQGPGLGRVSVLGAVKQPGVVQIGDNARLIEALAQLGGPAPNADLTKIQITHRDLSVEQVDLTNPTGTGNVVLRDGDVIAIPEQQSTVLTASIL